MIILCWSGAGGARGCRGHRVEDAGRDLAGAAVRPGSRPACGACRSDPGRGAQAGAGHGDVAEILRGGDHELMRGTAGARRHRASADRAGVHHCACGQVAGSAAPAGTRRPGPRPHDGQCSPRVRLGRSPGGRRSARSGRRSGRRAPGRWHRARVRGQRGLPAAVKPPGGRMTCG
jgi:hypothetical protein